MIRVENIETWGFEHAIRGMRNPKNSWDRSDSGYGMPGSNHFTIGKKDLELMQKLFKAGSEHRKYLRQIFVSMDITAPLYWWKEANTYKVGTVTNSCSTMHTIHKKPFVLDDFSHEHLNGTFLDNYLLPLIDGLNIARANYINTKDKCDWWQMIQLLPTSYNQRRTVTMNYENVANIIKQRSDHKLDEWRELCKVLRGLPYVKEIMEDTHGNNDNP